MILQLLLRKLNLIQLIINLIYEINLILFIFLKIINKFQIESF